MKKQLYEALKYAYELLLDQAETGHYPIKALAENGGKGYEPIQTAIKACESQKADTGESNCTIFDVRVMLPDNAVPHDIAKAFTDTKIKAVSGLLEEDYKTGYREGITHFIEAKGN